MIEKKESYLSYWLTILLAWIVIILGIIFFVLPERAHGQFKFHQNLQDRYCLLAIGKAPIGATTFKDISHNSSTITTNGATTIQSTTRKMFWDGSIYFPNITDNSNYLVSDATNLNIVAGDFTITCWIYITEFTTSNTSNILGPTYTSGYVGLFLQNYTNRGLCFWMGTSGTLTCDDVASYSTDTWNYIVVMRKSGVIYGFKNGIQKGNVAYSSDMSFIGNMKIGCSQEAVYLQNFKFYNKAIYNCGSNGTRYFYPPNKP